MGAGCLSTNMQPFYQVVLQAEEEGLGVGPFKKEGKGLMPLRDNFPSWPPEGARALWGFKDPIRSGDKGAGGSPPGGQGDADIGAGKPRNHSQEAKQPRLPRSAAGSGSSGAGEGSGEKRGFGERCGKGERPRPGAGGERGKRVERLLKELKARPSGAPTPASTPGQCWAPDAVPASGSGHRSPRLHLPPPPQPPPPQPPLLEGAETRSR